MSKGEIDGVPRELLENLLESVSNPAWYDGGWIAHKKEMRALLDAPVKKSPAWMDEPFAVAARGQYTQGEPMAVIKIGVKQVGNYGAAYDGPDMRRAYTYTHQPGNVEAATLGNAWLNTQRGGDSIDAGLSLIKQLEQAGYGVFKV